ncbi:hypothetical protein B0H13DRAFT_2389984 [Mycena leptocephala]|nr:hypothetical protein B0H13DRAFT_2389984 [Mycena leptocephala]
MLPSFVPISALPPGVPVVELSGPLIVAYLLHWGLFGSLTIQLFLYYQAFPKDKVSSKCLVYGIYMVEFVQTMLVTHDAFAMFGFGFGNVAALTNMHFDWLTVPIMSGLVAFVGQSFYAYRLHILSKSYVLPIFILAVSLSSTVGGIITGVFSFRAGDVTLLNNRKTSTAVGVWCGGSALSDILIAIFMTYYLAMSDTGFRQTHVLISKLIRLTIETGSVTAVVALANLILFFAFPGHTYYTTPALLMPKFYANTILAVLNARIQIVGGRATYVSTSDFTEVLSNSSYVRQRLGQSNDTGGGGNANATLRNVPLVEINKEVFSDRDADERVEMKPMGRSRDDAYV